jgi:hypothetical protein
LPTNRIAPGAQPDQPACRTCRQNRCSVGNPRPITIGDVLSTARKRGPPRAAHAMMQ